MIYGKQDVVLILTPEHRLVRNQQTGMLLRQADRKKSARRSINEHRVVGVKLFFCLRNINMIPNGQD